jgi:cold shock CspA family protein
MQTPVEIDFQGMNGSDKLRTSIINHVDGLEQRFGRITACRVAVKGPSEHHRKGAPYEITIRLLLPQGREIDIARTSVADERLADIDFALNDAFKRARRRLSDQARLIRGEVKSHNGQPTATVRRVDHESGFGFLETSDGREVYFHRNSVLNNGFVHLVPGARVAFSEETGEKGPQASTVKLLGKHGLR